MSNTVLLNYIFIIIISLIISFCLDVHPHILNEWHQNFEQHGGLSLINTVSIFSLNDKLEKVLQAMPNEEGKGLYLTYK